MAPREWQETAGPPPWRLLSPSGVLHRAPSPSLPPACFPDHPPLAALAALVVAQLTRGPPAECLQVDMRTRSLS